MGNHLQRWKTAVFTLAILNLFVLIVGMGNLCAKPISGQKLSLLGSPKIWSLAGSGWENGAYSGDGGPASNAELHYPYGTTVDNAGNVYIADSWNYAIRVVNTQNVAITVAGVTIQPGNIATVAGNGTQGVSGDGGSATSAQIGWVDKIAVDANNNIYLADSSYNYIRKVSNTGIISTFAGTAGGCNSSGSSSNGDGGLAVNATFECVEGITADSAGNVYIADLSSGLIRKVNTSGIISTVAGDKTINPLCGSVNASGDGGPAISAVFSCPTSVRVDRNNNLYVTDYVGSTVRVINTQNAPITVAGITIQPGNVDHIAGMTGIQGYAGDGSAAIGAELNYPYDASVDRQGNLYIADSANDVIRKVDTNGVITTFAGYYNGWDYLGDGGPATAAALYYPTAVVADAAGNVYISDTENNAIRKVSPSGGGSSVDFGAVSLGSSNVQMLQLYVSQAVTVSSVQANGDYAVVTAPVLPNSVHRSAPNGVAIPEGMPTIAAKRLQDAVAHRGSRQSFSSNSPVNGCVGTFAAGDICTVYVQFAPTKPGPRWFQLTATDSSQNNSTVGLTGTGVGSLSAITPGIIRTASGSSGIGYLTGLVRDSSGNTYVSDYIANVVMKIDIHGTVTVVAGISGQSGYDGDGALATSAHLYDPMSLAIDSVGNLYIADVLNNVIRKVDTNGIITTVAGNGTAGYSGDGGLATDAELDNPLGVLVDRSGSLYIGDTFNNVVRKVDTNGQISTIAGNGDGAGNGSWNGGGLPSGGYGGDGGPATLAQLNGPTALALGTNNNLYVADTWNNAIRKVDGNGTISLAAGTCSQVCQGGFTGDGGVATAAELNNPYGVAVDAAGDFYVADTGNSVIRKVDVNGVIQTVAGQSSGANQAAQAAQAKLVNWQSELKAKPMVSGAGGNSNGDGGVATAATIYIPVSVSVDNDGSFYLTDVEMQTIRAIDVTTSDMNFGSIGSGSISNPQRLTISDVGNASLNFSRISLSSNFSWVGSGACSTATPLSSGNSCNLTADFAPPAAGSYSGAIILTDDAFNSPHTVTLEGVATQPDYVISASTQSLSVAQGNTGSATLTVTPQNGYVGKIQFSCSGLPAESTCAFSPTSANLTNGSPVSVTLTLTTTGTVSHALLTAPEPLPGHGQNTPANLWFLPMGLAGMVLWGVKDGRSKNGRQMVMRILLSCALLTGVMGLNGCGGLAKSNTTHGTPTPTGTYSVTVTTTASAPAGSGQHTATIHLTVTQ